MGSVAFVGHHNHIEAVRFDENTLATQVILFRFELEGRLLPVQTGDHNPRADRLGIDRFVNLTQDYPGGTDRHLTHYDSHVEPHAEVGRYPIRDVYIPTEELMVEILDAVDNDLAAGHNIYVHCWGGVGRTGTVVGCWLIRHGYATAADVLEVISDLRIGDAGRGPNAGRGETRESPETLEQFDFVVGWEQGR